MKQKKQAWNQGRIKRRGGKQLGPARRLREKRKLARAKARAAALTSAPALHAAAVA